MTGKILGLAVRTTGFFEIENAEYVVWLLSSGSSHHRTTWLLGRFVRLSWTENVLDLFQHKNEMCMAVILSCELGDVSNCLRGVPPGASLSAGDNILKDSQKITRDADRRIRVRDERGKLLQFVGLDANGLNISLREF